MYDNAEIATHNTTMKAGDILPFSHDLDEYLNARYRLNSKICQIVHRTIRAQRVKFYLYFRWNANDAEYEGNTLVVARLFFRPPRQDDGTAVLQFIIDMQPRYGYDTVLLERCNNNAIAFAHRFGFLTSSTPK